MSRYVRVLAMSMSMFMPATALWAVPALAQESPRNEVVPIQRPIQVTDFAPRSGEIGTEVTIQGRGFTDDTRLLIGGRPVRPTEIQPTWIRFAVPEQYGDGVMILRHPGVARDIVVGTFSVIERALVTDFAPKSGAGGTRVEIRGRGFGPKDEVHMNGRPIAVNRRTPERLIVTIPPDAQSDYLTVYAAGSAQTRTATVFQVALPAPYITGLVPPSGQPGARVRITGEYLDAADRVYYGNIAVDIVARGPQFVEVVVPPSARRDDYFLLSGPQMQGQNQVRSPERFRLAAPAALPKIGRVAPAYGSVGQRIEIYGKDFQPGDRVRLGNAWLDIVQVSSNQITAVIPSGAQSGPVVLARGSIEVASPQSFDVLSGPVITGFTPDRGGPGTRVTITGQYFTPDTVVYYGDQSLRILRRRGSTSLVVEVPTDLAEEKPFLVRTAAGQTATAQPFLISVSPRLQSITPQSGHAGTQITLRGLHVRFIDAVYLDNVSLPIVSRGTGVVVVEVPAGARSGRIFYDAQGRRERTQWTFQVAGGPELVSFAPQVALPGADIAIRGRDLRPETEVYLGNYRLDVRSRGRDEWIVRLPDNLPPQSDYLRIRVGASESRAPSRLEILPVPLIQSIVPDRIEAGSRVLIGGRHFTPDMQVYWGDEPVPVLGVSDQGRRIEVQIPDHFIGVRYLYVAVGALRWRAPTQLEVLTPRPQDHDDGRKHKKHKKHKKSKHHRVKY